tara:strand:- start:1153 stop:1836 length:684 start_codon:yes stop_codon:yes gene_type:complete
MENRKIDVADNIDVIIKSWQLVYSEYLAAGFIKSNPFNIFTYHCILNKYSYVLYYLLNDEVVLTITLAEDKGYNSSLFSLFPEEIEKIRSEKKKVAELCLLARSQKAKLRMRDILSLMKATVQIAYMYEFDYFLIAVHPSHVSFYHRFFTMYPISEVKEYKNLNNQPAILLKGDFIAAFKSKKITEMHPFLRICYARPILLSSIDNRFEFNKKEINKSIIGDFLKMQ